jgi:transposase InsO family protein
MRAGIVIAAVANANVREYIAENAIFHSGKAAHYISCLLAYWTQHNDVRLSCSRSRNCRDDAGAESFFATLKNEMYYCQSFASRTEATVVLIEFIECYYDRHRSPLTTG